MLVRNVLDSKVGHLIAIGPEATVKQVLALFVEHNIGSLPVVDASGKLVGIFTERDVLYGDSRGPGDLPPAVDERGHDSCPGHLLPG